jgi:hypothetical protein
MHVGATCTFQLTTFVLTLYSEYNALYCTVIMFLIWKMAFKCTVECVLSFLTHGYSVGVFASYCHQPQNRRFLLFSSSLLCAPVAGRTGLTSLECFVIGCFHNACKHRAFGWISMSGLDIAVTIDFLLHDTCGFMRPLRTKLIPLFDSAKTIVLTDVKCIN